jgi:hypothetical protein
MTTLVDFPVYGLLMFNSCSMSIVCDSLVSSVMAACRVSAAWGRIILEVTSPFDSATTVSNLFSIYFLV